VNDQVFHIKVTAGSNPVTKWTIDFGDKATQPSSLSGKGEVDKDVTHHYKKRTGKIKNELTGKITEVPSYKVELTAVDSQKNEVKQTLSVAINQDDTGGTQSTDTTALQTKLKQKTKGPVEAGPIVDVSVKTLELPKEPYLGKSCKVNMVVKNNSSSAIQGCYAFFESEDGTKRRVRTSLTPESEKTVIFTWVPKKEGNQVINGYVECEGDKDTKDNKITKKVFVKK